MKIRVENAYSDGHCSSSLEKVPEFTEDPGPQWEALKEYLHQFTGDGHGIDADLGFCYTVTIVRADNPAFVDLNFEWVGA